MGGGLSRKKPPKTDKGHPPSIRGKGKLFSGGGEHQSIKRGLAQSVGHLENITRSKWKKGDVKHFPKTAEYVRAGMQNPYPPRGENIGPPGEPSHLGGREIPQPLGEDGVGRRRGGNFPIGGPIFQSPPGFREGYAWEGSNFLKIQRVIALKFFKAGRPRMKFTRK